MPVMQPQQFVEIGEALAGQIGVKGGDMVSVAPIAAFIKAVAVVTKRLRLMKSRASRCITSAFRFTGDSRPCNPGFLANTLTPVVGDSNSQTPEFKSFLVKVEKPRRLACHYNHSISVRRSATILPSPSVREPVGRRSRQAHRHDQVHRLQGLPGGLHGMERSAR